MPVFDYDSRQPQQQQQPPPAQMNGMNPNNNMQQSRHQYSQSGSTNSSGGQGGFRYNNGAGPPPNKINGNLNQSDYSPRSIPNGNLSNEDGMNNYHNGFQNGSGPNINNQQQASSSSSSSAPPTKTRRPRPDTDEIRRTGRTHYQELLGFLKSHLAKSECLHARVKRDQKGS